MRSRKLFLTGKDENRDFVQINDYDGFAKAVKMDSGENKAEYADIKDEYLKILWEALKKESVVADGQEDAFAEETATSLLFQRQKKQILELAAKRRVLSLDSPFAKVMFNCWGHREESCGTEET